MSAQWNDAGEKMCVICRQWKTAEEYYREPDGRIRSECVECFNARRRRTTRRYCPHCKVRRNAASFRFESEICITCERMLHIDRPLTFWIGYEKQIGGYAPTHGG